MGVKVRWKRGKYWVVIDYRRIRKSICVGAKKAADAAAIAIQAKLAAGDSSPLTEPAPTEPPVTFSLFAERWLKQAAAVCKPTTLRFYEMNLRLYINPVIGSTPLAGLRRSDCRAVIIRARAETHTDDGKVVPGLKPKSLEGVARTMSTVLSQAVEDELLPANPAFRLGKHIGRKGRVRASDINPFTREEVVAFLAAVDKREPEYYPFFLCALRTGMRLGELLALEWDDIDFNAGFIDVRRNLAAGVEGTPKNGKSRRVDMSTQLAKELRQLQTTRKAQKLARRWKAIPKKVFCTPEGGPLDGDNLRRRVFAPLFERAKLRRVRLHDLRHTFAALLIQQNESLAYVSQQLGHSSIQVTVDIYGHLIPGANRQAVDRLDDTAAASSGDKTKEQMA